MSGDALDGARAAAEKIVAPDGAVPKEKHLAKDHATEAQTRGAMGTALATFSAKLIAYKKAADAMKESAQAYRDDVDSSTMHLNPKDAKQKKQIADAQKVLFEALDGYIERSDKRVKAGETIYKAVADFPKQINNIG